MPRHALHVMLDTSVIYSIGADTVLAGGLLDAITEYRQQNFVTVHWHMPEMVVMEREEQLIA